jgi:hypothetical protein
MQGLLRAQSPVPLLVALPPVGRALALAQPPTAALAAAGQSTIYRRYRTMHYH